LPGAPWSGASGLNGSLAGTAAAAWQASRHLDAATIYGNEP